MLEWTWDYRCLSDYWFYFLWLIPRTCNSYNAVTETPEDLLDHVFYCWYVNVLLSITAMPIYVSTHYVPGLPFVDPSPASTWSLGFSIVAVLMTALMSLGDLGLHFVMISKSHALAYDFCKNFLFRSFVHFFPLGLIVFLLCWVVWVFSYFSF